jgi:hypothetical protein
VSTEPGQLQVTTSLLSITYNVLGMLLMIAVVLVVHTIVKRKDDISHPSRAGTRWQPVYRLMVNRYAAARQGRDGRACWACVREPLSCGWITTSWVPHAAMFVRQTYAALAVGSRSFVNPHAVRCPSAVPSGSV